MQGQQLINEASWQRLKVDGASYQRAAGIATDTSEVIDTGDMDSVVAELSVGAIAATGTIVVKAQHSKDNGVADAFVDIPLATVAFGDTDDNKVALIELKRPRRYVRFVTTRAVANGAIDGLRVIRHGARTQPVAQGSMVMGAVYVINPD